MARDKTDKTNKTPATTAERDSAIEFVTGMIRSIQPRPHHRDVLAFREMVELYAIIPDTPLGEAVDFPERGYDIEFNAKKLPELVAIYEKTLNPYALHVLRTIFENALLFSRPIPDAMLHLVREWVYNGGLKHTRAADPAILSRDATLVAALIVLRDKGGIRPYRNSATKHEKSGFDIAVSIWNKIAAESLERGLHRPPATYHAARDAWKAYRFDCGGDESAK